MRDAHLNDPRLNDPEHRPSPNKFRRKLYKHIAMGQLSGLQHALTEGGVELHLHLSEGTDPESEAIMNAYSDAIVVLKLQSRVQIHPDSDMLQTALAFRLLHCNEIRPHYHSDTMMLCPGNRSQPGNHWWKCGAALAMEEQHWRLAQVGVLV